MSSNQGLRRTGYWRTAYRALLPLLLAAAVLTACTGISRVGRGPERQATPQCSKLTAGLSEFRFVDQWRGFSWQEYGFDNVTIPDDIAGLRLGGVSCTEDHIAGEVTSVFTELYRPGEKQDDAVALLLVGEKEPAHRETWEDYLKSTFPGDWQFRRTGSVLVGTPRAVDDEGDQ